MRCFIGIPMARIYQDQLREIIEGAGAALRSKINWTHPGNWHLTLKFLGDVKDSKVPEIIDCVRAMSFRSFDLRAGKVGFFPGVYKPRIVWIGLNQGRSECTELAETVERRMVRIGLKPESRSFRPHLSLGRVKQLEGDDWKEFQASLGQREWPSIKVDEVVLWESILSLSGPKYKRLAGCGPVESNTASKDG